MMLNLDDITKEGLTFDLRVDEETIKAFPGASGFELKTPVSARVFVTRAGNTIEISGNLKASLELQCGRCLKHYTLFMEKDFSKALLHDLSESDKEEVALTAEELDFSVITGEEIDLKELLLEEFFLELPGSPVCSDDCKGLCLRCGTDLNIEGCDCSKKVDIDPRLAKLKGFRAKRD